VAINKISVADKQLARDGVLAIAKVVPRAFTAEITKACDLKLGWRFALQRLLDF